MSEEKTIQEGKDPLFMQEMLTGIGDVEEGSLVDGVVVQVSGDYVFLDVKCKSEGKIPVSEFDVLPNVGDIVPVVLKTKENRWGEVVISKQEADVAKFWRDLRDAKKNHTAIHGKIAKVVKGGFEVDLGGGILAFLPTSQADVQKIEDPQTCIGVEGDFFVEKCEKSRDNRRNASIVVNRRRYLEQKTKENREKFFAETHEGDTVTGVVKSFTSFGAFVDLGGFDGLLHIHDMSWGHVTKPKDFVRKGQKIELCVIRLDPENQRINLSLKHFSEDPWVHFEENFHVDDIVRGKVTKLTDFGAFIELAEGIEGLAHISEFSWTERISKAEDMLKIGDEVDCMILGYDTSEGHVSLGIKQALPNPWDTIELTYPVGTKVHGSVTKLTNNGALLRLDDGIVAYLSAEDFSWTRKLKHLGSQVSVGDELDAVVLKIDIENKRIYVGVKQLVTDPWIQFEKDNPVGTKIEGEVVSITEFGIFVHARDGIEGLIGKQNLTAGGESFEDACVKYKVGDKVTVYVENVNSDKHKVGFSLNEIAPEEIQAATTTYYVSGKDEDDAYTLGDLIKEKK